MLSRDLQTIEEYVLADSRSPRVEVYRKKNGLWIYNACENDDDVTFHSVGFHLSLVDIYAGVEFELR
jgi:hypothetical protein